ncbi:MAG: hypothetical protein GY776_02220 [Alteromonas sp.]|nr:hypothetical protein [Alteromonas sp.]
MPKMKRKPTAALKVKVAIAAITEKLTTSQIVSRHKVNERQVKVWKKEGLDAMKYRFSNKALKDKKAQDDLIAGLYEQIGRFQTELDYMKKKVTTDH